MNGIFRLFKERELNLLAILLLCISMGFGFFIEFGLGQIPCTLCFLQRICMMGIAFSLYLNVLRGIHVRHYGFALIWALLGISCALRHVALNVCKPVPSDAFLFLSYRIYTWSFLTFFCSILGIALLLCLNKKTQIFSGKQKKDRIVYVTAGLLLLMLTIGFFSVFQKQGWDF